MPAAGGLLCGASGLALLVAATATHFWVQRRAPGGTASLGLWHGCLGGQCHPHATTPALLEATRVLMLLSVVAAAAGTRPGLVRGGQRGPAGAGTSGRGHPAAGGAAGAAGARGVFGGDPDPAGASARLLELLLVLHPGLGGRGAAGLRRAFPPLRRFQGSVPRRAPKVGGS